MRSIKDIKKDLIKKYGCVKYDGKSYILVENVILDYDCIRGNYYTARAINMNEEPDEDDYVYCYEIRWEILNDFDSNNDEDEGNACDWNTPVGADDIGDYNIITGQIYC